MVANKFHWNKIGLYIELVSALVRRDLKVRYSGTILGLVWSLVHPLLFTLIISYVFSSILRAEIEHFHVFFLSALFPWIWLSTSISAGVNSVTDNAHLIKKVSFPRGLIPATVVITNMVHFLFSLPVYIGFAVAAGVPMSAKWIVGVPTLTLLQLLFTLGLTMIVASLNVYFRDVGHLVTVFLNLWFYVTPILYSPDMLPDHIREILFWNPATYITIAWRSLLYHGIFPEAHLAILIGISIATFVLGSIVFRRLSRGFADVL